MTLKSLDIPRQCADRQTVANWQQAKAAMDEKNTLLAEFSENVRIRPGPSMRVLDTRYSPVGLWNMDVAPGGAIADSSGNGNNLVIENGTLRTSSLYPTIGGVYFDGVSNLWCASSPAVLQQLGAMTLIMAYMCQAFPAAGAVRTIVSHDTAGETSDTNYLYRWGIDNLNQGQYFSEHGAGVDDPAGTLSTAPLNQPALVAITRDASGNLKHGLNGLILGGPFGTVTLPTDGHNGHFRIGAEHALGNPFMGVVLFVALYNFAMSGAQFLDIYNYTMGPAYGYRRLQTVPDDLQPVFYAQEDVELASAAMVPDQTSGTFSKTQVSASLYRLDSSGSTASAKLLGSIDGSVPSAQPWSPFRAQQFRLATDRPNIKSGELIAVSGKSSDWNGDLMLHFRRVLDA